MTIKMIITITSNKIYQSQLGILDNCNSPSLLVDNNIIDLRLQLLAYRASSFA